ncbi:MAG: hypothetical protein M1833_004957 [Piccolia ochrophora]|nr:MAG: hypothetical protein M1833_004957 [Piccolia ochrophora]
MGSRDVSPAFEKAAEDSKLLTSKPSNDDLLEACKLYALFKQAKQDPPIEDAPVVQAGWSYKSQAAKRKRSTWQKLVDEGITPEEAEQRYIEKVETMKKDYGFNPDKEPEQVG